MPEALSSGTHGSFLALSVFVGSISGPQPGPPGTHQWLNRVGFVDSLQGGRTRHGEALGISELVKKNSVWIWACVR